MGARNKVKLQIVKDVTKSGKNTLNKFARVGKLKPSSASRSEMEPLSPGDQRTTPSAVPAIPSDMLSLTPDSKVVEFLEAVPFPTRNELTAAILAKVDSAKVLKHEGSMLFQNKNDDWVADLLPEKMAEIDTSSTPQVTGPTPTMV